MLKQALQYLERGWPVVPCFPKTKVPRVEWAKYQERLPERSSIETWFANSDNNIVLITGRLSGIVIVDIDPRNGGTIEGHETTLCTHTPGGGWHLYYKHPGTHVSNSAGAYAPGLDIRGDGGCAMLPPSYVVERGGEHEYEGSYSWVKGVALAPLPERFLKPPPQIKGPSTPYYQGSAVNRILMNGAGEGQRNDAIASIAGQYARKEMDIDLALLSIQALNKAGETISPPLDPAEVECTVRSIYKGHKRRETSKVKEYREVQLAGKSTGDFDVVPYGQYMADNAPSEANWLLPGWLLRETIALLVAPPESYKTWLEFDMAVAIAGGLPFLDSVVPAMTGPVLIIQQEDHPGQNVERISTIQHVREGIPKPRFHKDRTIEITFPTDLPILFHPDAKLQFGEPKCMTALDKVLDRYRPALVVVDPLYSATRKTDDYMAGTVQDMMVLKQWRETYGTSFLIGHHTSKSANKSKSRERLWGSQLLNGFLEQHIHLWKLDCGKELVVRRGSKRAGQEAAVHIKLDICTDDHDVRYNISCEDVTEEHAEKLINPVPEGTTRSALSPRLSELSTRFLEDIQSSGPQDARVWAVKLGIPHLDAKRAGDGLVAARRAWRSGWEYRCNK